MAWDDIVAQNLRAQQQDLEDQFPSPAVQSQINLTNQQAAGLAIQNRVASMQADYLAKLPGALAAANQSGDTGSGVSAPTGVGPGGGAPVSSLPMFDPRLEGAANTSGDFNVDRGAALRAAQQNFTPIPANAYSPEELQALQYASLSGNTAAVQTIQQQHALRVDTANARIARAANEQYTDAYTVATAPDGQALQTLRDLSDPGARALADRYEQEGLDDDQVKQHAAQLAAITYTTARLPVDFKTDGVARDTEGRAIPGYNDHIGLSPDNIKQLGEDATAQTDTFINGVAAKVPRYQLDGFKTPDAWVMAHVDLANARKNGTPQSPAVPYSGPPPSAAPGEGSPSPVARIFSGQPAAPAGGPVPNQQRQAPGQQPTDTGLLPGVNPNALPKATLPQIPPGQTPSITDKGALDAYAAKRTEVLNNAQQTGTDAAKTNSLINQAQGELANLANDPRYVGPHSAFTQALANFKTYVSGQAPDALVDRSALDKMLLQLGAQNVRTLLSGQRITNQEMMTFLTKGNPSGDQPLATVGRLLNYLKADNDYDRRSAVTTIKAVQGGADPWRVSGAIENSMPRAQFVGQRTGFGALSSKAAPTGAAPALPAVGSAADYANLPKGARYTAPDGSVRVKGGQ
jgi:hypothetical protein